ncbi:calcium/sodium antiporter [Microvenator marinus]|jgi:cation:H+ antiporter|uniref:Calcium/sodium antiporter n=1 Tax=Microvenator marinus TaxID=2600177 RepID=A0A5B8XPN9_9DELT|nr:calcium/sodium antiporter [Microvenator marinus]QED26918.1 calcium/sodium antiporter [Microvenator marinus]
MLLPIVALVLGLILLVWSADKFVVGASDTAAHFGMPPLLIGMIIVGFGTSAPEIVVSVLAAFQGNPGLALGNAYGSNITNIALILGVTALISPIAVQSQILKRELPILIGATLLTAILLSNLMLARSDAGILLGAFGLFMAWSIWSGLKERGDHLGKEMEDELDSHHESIGMAVVWTVVGLILLVISSRMLVWGAVEIAQSLGVSDLVIGLTVVAIGTSLPELASSVMAARRGEHDIALGNVIGSNMFNTLVVVGLAGVIHPLSLEKDLLYRDVTTMTVMTIALVVLGYGFKGQGRINRVEGGLLFTSYFVYTTYLVLDSLGII